MSRPKGVYYASSDYVGQCFGPYRVISMSYGLARERTAKVVCRCGKQYTKSLKALYQAQERTHCMACVTRRTKSNARAAMVARMRAEGDTFTAIGKKLGVSKQRIFRLMQRHERGNYGD